VELTRAHELGKSFVPLLDNLTHEEFQRLKPIWHYILGGASSIKIPSEGFQFILKQLLAGIKALGIVQSSPNYPKIEKLKKMLSLPTSHAPSESATDIDIDMETVPLDFPQNQWKFMDPRISIIVYEDPKPKIFSFDGRKKRKIFIGRDPRCDIVLHTKETSREHGLFVYDLTQGWMIKDLKSRNHIYHLGREVQEIELRPFDEIEIGGIRLVVRNDLDFEGE
jgi:hypothetical protein